MFFKSAQKALILSSFFANGAHVALFHEKVSEVPATKKSLVMSGACYSFSENKLSDEIVKI